MASLSLFTYVISPLAPHETKQDDRNTRIVVKFSGRTTRTGRSSVHQHIFFCYNTPAYQIFKTHKLSPEDLLNVDIKDIPVRLLQYAGNINTSRITTFLEFILKPISGDFCKKRL